MQTLIKDPEGDSKVKNSTTSRSANNLLEVVEDELVSPMSNLSLADRSPSPSEQSSQNQIIINPEIEPNQNPADDDENGAGDDEDMLQI